jgi:hypothetical protein
MVVPEPVGPLLLYTVATSEVVSMVLVTERPDPHSTHELRGSPADSSWSQDPGPVEEPRVVTTTESQSPEAAADPHDQAVVGPWPGHQRPHQTQRIGSPLGLLQWK